MDTFLVIFSLMLHGITFMFLIYIYRQTQVSSADERQLQKTIREMEDLFQSYLLELKDENEKLIKLLNDKKQKNKRSFEEINNISAETSIQEKSENHPHERTEENKDESRYDPEKLITEDPVQYEQPSYQSMALQLYNQGYSIEEIAQKLNKGKTEIELIVKFYT